ncbi:hypothetical protein EMCRGX_G018103 [Ephydatia muelleri]|eukprot:Em0012g489a
MKCRGCWSRINKPLLGGIAVLFIVDVLWVGSAGLSEYIFQNGTYPKPLFTTYFETSLFSIYLVAFIFWRPWQRACCPVLCKKKLTSSLTISTSIQGSGNYVEIHSNGEEDESEALISPTDKTADVNQETGQIEDGTINRASSNSLVEPTISSLSPAQFHPLNICDSEEEDEKEGAGGAVLSVPSGSTITNRKVRFKRTIEVRQALSSSSLSTEVARGGDPPIMSVRVVVILAFVFGLMWFFANYLYQFALLYINVASVNTLSSLSSIFVFILAALPPLQSAATDKFTLSKLLIIVVSIGGAVLVGLSPSNNRSQGGENKYVGFIMVIAGAILYAFYLVLLKRFVPNPEMLEIPMFFGFVGLSDTIIILPCLLIWDFAGWEQFSLPPTSGLWTLLLIDGFVGTVLSELLWLWGVFLTSPLIGTLSLTLVTPLSIAYSIFVGKASISWEFFIGALVMILAFVCITLLDNYSNWDPVWIGIRKLCTAARGIRARRGYQSLAIMPQGNRSREDSTAS